MARIFSENNEGGILQLLVELCSNVTVPVIAETTGTANSFFLFAAVMNGLAVIAWIFMNPRRQLKEISRSALKFRLGFFLVLIVLVLTALIYTKLIYNSSGAKTETKQARLNLMTSEVFA